MTPSTHQKLPTPTSVLWWTVIPTPQCLLSRRTRGLSQRTIYWATASYRLTPLMLMG